MKRLLCVLLSCLLLSGCASQPVEETPVTEPTSIPVVVPIAERADGGVKVTVHAGLLGMDSEVLSDEQKADGFVDAVRNEDGSVTYTIDETKYEAFREKKYQKTCTSIDETVRGNFPSVTGISYEKDLSAVTITAMRETYEFSVDSLVVFAVGTLIIAYQAYDIDAVGTCVITVLDENGEQISETVYPDELIL